MKLTHLFVYSFFFVSAVVKAQFVTIPDANFRTFLKSNYPSCFNTNEQMDTTCTSITSLQSINVAQKNISNLDGIQYFDALYVLVCFENKLTSLPKLPFDLKALVCFRNKLNVLPVLPDGLQTLSCASNNLSFLPNLPNSIATLACDSNKISSLPSLPSALGSLKCNQNELKSLPSLPSSLSVLEANGNCLDEQMTNPNPSVLKTFKIAPNRSDCGILTYLKKVTADKYLVSYEKPVGTDYGVSLLEYRCGYGYGTAELANIAEFHKKYVDFDDYKVKNLRRGILYGNNDTVTYNVTKYFIGDTLRIPKADTVIVSADSRISNGNIYANWKGYSVFFLKDENSDKNNNLFLSQVYVPQKVIKYESRAVSDFLYFFPHKETPITTKPKSTKQVLAELKMYYKDTTFTFQNLDISCTTYKISDSEYSRRTVFSVPRTDSVILKIQEGKSNLKNIKLVYAIYSGNTSILDRNYTVCDSISSFGSSDVILRHKGALDGMVMQEGDSIHYQLIAEFDTLQKPVIFESNNITFRTSMAKDFYRTFPVILKVLTDIVHNDIVLSKSLTICGNYKVKANIVGDTVNCLNALKTYTSKVNLNDKSLAYVWKYNTSQSTFADFNVTFPSTGTKSMELTLTSNCGTDKAIKNIQTITTPTKPTISQTGNVLTSSTATGNTWYKDGLLLANQTNKTLTITSSAKYKVTATNSCGSATSNEIAAVLTGNEESFLTETIQIYPNPMTSELVIEGLNQEYSAEILNQYGLVVISKNLSTKNTIDVSGLNAGMYFLRLYDDKGTVKLARKLLKN